MPSTSRLKHIGIQLDVGLLALGDRIRGDVPRQRYIARLIEADARSKGYDVDAALEAEPSNGTHPDATPARRTTSSAAKRDVEPRPKRQRTRKKAQPAA
jgi:hypothetical protein